MLLTDVVQACARRHNDILRAAREGSARPGTRAQRGTPERKAADEVRKD